MSLIGNPDWQNGVVNPGLELAVVTSPNVSKVVTAPPNTDALWVYVPQLFASALPTCVGSTSGISYQGVLVLGAYVFSIETTVDSQYTVTIPAPLPSSWYIVAQSWGSVVTANLPAQLQTDGEGLAAGQAGILVAGSDGGNGHTLRTDFGGRLLWPPSTIIGGGSIANGSQCLAAPAGGTAWYVTGAAILCANAVGPQSYSICTTSYSATTTVIALPPSNAVNEWTTVRLASPMKVTTALFKFDMSNAATDDVTIWGFSGPP